MPITINGSTGVAGIDGSAGTPSVQGADTNTGVFFPAADTVALSTGGTERMRVNSSGDMSIGTTSADGKVLVERAAASAGWIVNAKSTGVVNTSGIYADSSNNIEIVARNGSGTQTIRMASSGVSYVNGGNVGLGTASPAANLHISSSGVPALRMTTTEAGHFKSELQFSQNANLKWAMGVDAAAVGNNNFFWYDVVAAVERMRIDASGNLLVGTTNSDPASANIQGVAISSGSFGGYISASRSANQCAGFNRAASDGNIIVFQQDGAVEGSISVSGTTISYNAFAGSHWSQLSDSSRPDILTGTVVETIDEKCVWPGEDNDQLAKFKVSDTVASRRVYGVFMAWDNDDDENNDAYITGLGAYLIRIAPGVAVEGGDLLESNGDGCARVQADDIIRSSTIAKVTCNIPTQTYDDGSYTVPCVLYCG